MAKDIHVTLSAKKRRALNDVDFSAVIDSLAQCKLEIRDPRSNSPKNWSFDCPGNMILVNRNPLNKFLGDVQIIVGENAQYEREQVELRRANEHFSAEHVRLSKRVVEQEGALASLTQQRDNEREANVVWENRNTAVQSKRDALGRQVESLQAQLTAKDALLNAAGRDLETLRERTTGFQEELSAALKERDAMRSSRDQFAAARDRQRDTIIGFQTRLAAFDAEATRLRAEVAEERAAQRMQQGVADGLRAALADVTAERDSFKGMLDWADRTRSPSEHPTAHLVRRTQQLEAELAAAKASLPTANTIAKTVIDIAAHDLLNAEISGLRGKVVELEKWLVSSRHSFRLADQALSARNVELAKANSALNELRATLAAGNAVTSKVVLTMHNNGAVTLDAGESPVTLRGHVWAEANVKITGELSS